MYVSTLYMYMVCIHCNNMYMYMYVMYYCMKVESRQKIIEAKEKEEDEEIKSKMDEDEPLNSCRDKAVFLLKFAGLTRVTYDSSRPSSPITSRPSWGQKSGRLQKSQSVVSTVGRIKQQVHGCGLLYKMMCILVGTCTLYKHVNQHTKYTVVTTCVHSYMYMYMQLNFF